MESGKLKIVKDLKLPLEIRNLEVQRKNEK